MVVVHNRAHDLWRLVEALVPTDDSGASDVDFNIGLLMRYPSLQRTGRILQHCSVIFFSFHALVSSIHSEGASTSTLTQLLRLGKETFQPGAGPNSGCILKDGHGWKGESLCTRPNKGKLTITLTVEEKWMQSG